MPFVLEPGPARQEPTQGARRQSCPGAGVSGARRARPPGAGEPRECAPQRPPGCPLPSAVHLVGVGEGGGADPKVAAGSAAPTPLPWGPSPHSDLPQTIGGPWWGPRARTTCHTLTSTSPSPSLGPAQDTLPKISGHSLNPLAGVGPPPQCCLGAPCVSLALQTGSGIENVSIIYKEHLPTLCCFSGRSGSANKLRFQSNAKLLLKNNFQVTL